jgi:hypothetical protein
MVLFLDINQNHLRRFFFIISTSVSTSIFLIWCTLALITSVILKEREPNRLCIDFEGEIVFIVSLYEG